MHSFFEFGYFYAQVLLINIKEFLIFFLGGGCAIDVHGHLVQDSARVILTVGAAQVQ